MAATSTRTTRKPPADKAQTAVAAPTAEPKATTPARVRKALVPVAGCSALVDGQVVECGEHKTYASDPHCRVRTCPNWIGTCDVHELQKGGTVVVIAQPVQQPQARARRRRTAR